MVQVILFVAAVVVIAGVWRFVSTSGGSCYDEGVCPNMGTCDSCEVGYPE